MKRFSIVYFTLAALIVGGMIYYDLLHRQNCLALYGVNSFHDNVDYFLGCEDDNTVLAFSAQLIALIAVFISVPLSALIKWIWDKVD